MNSDERAAQEQVARYGPRAAQIVAELIESCQANDHRKGGQLCTEMHAEPNLLLLVVGLLTSTVVKLSGGHTPSDGPIATPEELGMPADYQPETWQVGLADQLEAAAANNDIDTFAAVAVDGQIRSMHNDLRDQIENGGEFPTTQQLMRAFLVMDRGALITVGAEMLRRLLKQEVERGR